MTPRLPVTILGGLCGALHAGTGSPAPPPDLALGTLHHAEDNPWLSHFQVTGLLQWQAAHVDGTGNDGRDFSDRYTDWRRFRLGARVEFLRYFSYRGMANLTIDQRFNGGDLDWGYSDFFNSQVAFDLRAAAGLTTFDELTVSYGRFKWLSGLEARTSATELLTPERSAISNKLFGPFHPTGIVLEAAKGETRAIFGIYSSDEASDAAGADDGNVEGWGGWNDGLMSNLSLGGAAGDHLTWGWDLVCNHADEIGSGEDSLLDYRWATALSAELAIGRGGVNVEAFYGDNGGPEMHANTRRRGNFGGLVATPYYWIVPDKLQAVVQYVHAGAQEAEGIRLNSRYVRATGFGGGGNPDVISGGRGDELHTLYAGINYLVHGHHLKFQAGVEYARLDAAPLGVALKGSEVDALTWIFAFRSSF